jgi:hypothetical protein
VPVGLAEVVAALPTAVSEGQPEFAPPAMDLPTPTIDPALVTSVVMTLDRFVACWNAGNGEALLSLVTPRYLQTRFNVRSVAAARLALSAQPTLPPIALIEPGAIHTYPDGRLSLDYTYQLGRYQIVRARLILKPAGPHLLLDDEAPLWPRPLGDTTVIGFSLADDTSPISFDQSEAIAASPVVILSGVNDGDQRHIVMLWRQTTGASGDPLLGGEFVGYLSLAPGERQEMVLLDLPPGIYRLVDGAVVGSAATLIVTEPAA